jgi:hypothetical protein
MNLFLHFQYPRFASCRDEAVVDLWLQRVVRSVRVRSRRGSHPNSRWWAAPCRISDHHLAFSHDANRSNEGQLAHAATITREKTV